MFLDFHSAVLDWCGYCGYIPGSLSAAAAGMPPPVLTAEAALWADASYSEPEPNHSLHCPSHGALHSQPVKQTANGGSCSSAGPVQFPWLAALCLSSQASFTMLYVSVREGVTCVYSSCMTRAVLDMSSLENSGAEVLGDDIQFLPIDLNDYVRGHGETLQKIWAGVKHMQGINLNSTDFYYVVNSGYKSVCHNILHSPYQMQQHILRWKVHVVAWPPLQYLHSVVLSIAISMWNKVKSMRMHGPNLYRIYSTQCCIKKTQKQCMVY